MESTVKEFLRESNAIEDVWDTISLKDAVVAWGYIIGEKELTVNNILLTHKLLMLHQNVDNKYKGAFRDCQVWIGGREGKPFYSVPYLVENWVENANDLVKRIEPDDAFLEDFIKDHHVQFEEIHPFIDGNGRLGRILWQWQRKKNGLPIQIIYEKDKFEYYKWFK